MRLFQPGLFLSYVDRIPSVARHQAAGRLASFLCLSVLLLGCGRSDLATVTGTVTFKGEPLKRGHIVLEPDNGRSARGTIVDGKLTDLHTYEQGDGVRIGTHKVSIIAFIREPVGMEIVPSLIPTHYNSPTSSGLTATIERGKNELLFELVE